MSEVIVNFKIKDSILRTGTAVVHVDNLQALVSKSHSSEVKLHMKFDGGASPKDGIFDFEIDYHLTHADGDGVEEGELDIIRKKVGGQWETQIKTFTKPFSAVPIIPAT